MPTMPEWAEEGELSLRHGAIKRVLGQHRVHGEIVSQERIEGKEK